MKKIGVLTYLKEYSNLGTNMQSYCTLKAIEKAYPNDQVELIDYSGWKPAMRPYLSQVSIKSLVNDFSRIKKYKRFFKEDLVLSKQQLISADLKKSIDFIKEQKYDAIYVGSDTLLELKRAGKDELTAYWLDESVECKKFLIAASAHSVIFDSLTAQQKSSIKKTIDGFSLLGVRDEATYRLLSNVTPANDKRMEIVPDPTFTFKINYGYIRKYFKRKNLVLNKPVVCLHLLRDTRWAAELAVLFKKAGYIVASLRPAYYADIIFTDLSPFEQIGLYKYFALVITHRFHDSIFSIKNLTPVIVFPEYTSDVTSYGESKNKTLFKSFNIEDNYIGDKESITAANLFAVHKKAIANFRNNENFIKTKLAENNASYEAFVTKSTQFI